MEDAKVCRICLTVNVKMHDLQSYPLDSYFASVMSESKPLYTYNWPSYACYQCTALMKKFYLFKQRCIRSQELLCGVIDKCGKITAAKIKGIIKPNLVISHVTRINLQEEVTKETPNFTVEVIKKEDHDDDYVSNSPDLGVSSDEEEIKEKLTKNSENVDVEKVEIHVKMDVSDELENKESTRTTDVFKAPSKVIQKSQPKKPRRPRKTNVRAAKKKPLKVGKDDGSDDKTEMEDITVITLTMEEQMEEMNKRKQSLNYLNCPYQCHQCYKGFINTQAWKHHVTRHSPSAGDIECAICKYRFKTKRTMQRHALNHGKKYVCKLCPYNSSNITTVKQHQGSHKGVTHKCDYCDEVFTVRTTYVTHMRIKHPSENICGFCGYSFYSKQGLHVHKNMVHKDIAEIADNKDGPYCAECDVKFITMEAYKRHMVMSVKHTRSTDSINGCRVCGASFSNAEELRVHHRKEHPKRQSTYYRTKTIHKWPAQCEHCSEEVPNARAYWKHFRNMHPNENYPVEKKCVCDVCGKRFMCNALLVMHKRTHSGDRPYKCSQCDKACFTAFDLRVHQQKHSDTRPFPCTICPKAFKRKEALDRHLKIHSGDNPYKCEICGVAFNKSCTRTLHVRTVHTKEPAPTRKRRNKLN